MTNYYLFRYLVQTYISKKSAASFDAHWRPQVLLCHPCRFNYSYIIKFENLALEANRLLDYIQTYKLNTALAERLSFPDKKKPATNNSVTKDTMQQIPERLVKHLRRIYADDFLLYDYDPYLYAGA